MEHLAIDLGGRESQTCVRGSDGSDHRGTAMPAATLGRYLAARQKSRVTVEACTEVFAVTRRLDCESRSGRS